MRIYHKHLKKLVYFVIFALCACDIELNTTINVSDLLSDTNKKVLSDLIVEVTDCSEETIQKVVDEIKGKDISVRYNKCKNNGPNSYATFSMPLMIIKYEEVADKGDIYLSVKDEKVYINSSDRIKSLLKSDYNSLKFSNITFNLVNDMEDSTDVYFEYAFIDEKPVISNVVTIEQYSKTNIKLADVAGKQLEQPNSSFQIMDFSKKENKHNKEDNVMPSVVVNPEVPTGRPLCGIAEKTQGCVLYIMNPQRQDLNGRDFYDLAAQLTGRQRFVIETGNMRYATVRIKPGNVAQINIPPLQY